MRMEKAMSGRKASINSTFDVDKAIAATGYLIDRTKESLYPVMKMMYLADKLHLERYGRFIAGDHYSAMAKGPVPSCTYNMLKHVRGDKQPLSGLDRAREFFAYNSDHSLGLRQVPDYGDLSESEIECLDAIADAYARIGKWAIKDLSHDTAWSDAWESRDKSQKRGGDMRPEDVARQFENSEALIEHLRDPTPGEAPAVSGVVAARQPRRA